MVETSRLKKRLGGRIDTFHHFDTSTEDTTMVHVGHRYHRTPFQNPILIWRPSRFATESSQDTAVIMLSITTAASKVKILSKGFGSFDVERPGMKRDGRITRPYYLLVHGSRVLDDLDLLWYWIFRLRRQECRLSLLPGCMASARCLTYDGLNTVFKF